jgi:CubicO group peptidase (beta-lactamase class C family)
VELYYGSPKEAGLDELRLANVDRLMKRYVNDAFPGAVLLIARRGVIAFHESYGKAQIVPVERIMQKDMIFDLASLTKSLVTSIIIMRLIEEGLINLRQKISTIFNEINKDETKREITILHLLTHTSGLPAWEPFYIGLKDKNEIIKAALNAFPSNRPGEKFTYSDLGYIILTGIAEYVTGKTFDELFKEYVMHPLKLKDTMFNPPESLKPRIVATELCQWRREVLVGKVHDENAYAMGGISGHAGLFSTAFEIAKIAQTMLNYGTYGSNEILSKSSVTAMIKNYVKNLNAGYGLGWMINDNPNGTSAGDLFSERSFGHTGFTGTSVWIDPEKELIVVLLTNRIHPTRENTKLIELRPRIHNAIASTIKS